MPRPGIGWLVSGLDLGLIFIPEMFLVIHFLAVIEVLYLVCVCATAIQTATGLPTKDKTSETIVRNLFCLFSYIQHSQKT